MSSRPFDEDSSDEQYLPEPKKPKVGTEMTEDEKSSDDENSSYDEICLLAVPLTMPLEPALKKASGFVDAYINKFEEQGPNWEDRDPDRDGFSSWGVSTQEDTFDACPHKNDDGDYDCVCHQIGDALGYLSQDPSQRESPVTQEYLLWLKGLIAETLMASA
jgi:hypothetical protein